MAVPLAWHEWQKKTPFSALTAIEGRLSEWTGQQAICSPHRASLSSTP